MNTKSFINFNKFNKFKVQLINFYKNISNDSYNLLGRWCHKGLPNCNESVINRKIDLALLDNNLCFKNNSINSKFKS